MGLLGALAGRLIRIPKIIFTGHGWAFNEDRSKLQKKIIYLLHLLTIFLSHKVIAVSEQTKNQISRGNSYNKKIIVIKNGLDKINFLNKALAKKTISAQLPSDFNIEHRPWIGTISELHKNKGLKYLIEAIHLLDLESDDKSNLPVVIIIGDGEKKEKLQQRIIRYNLEDTVFLVGRIDEAQKYLKAFDIFTLTSITEALPYVILEAGQAGLPIIASGVGGIPEIIDDMENGILVRPKEPVEIKKAITFLLNNSEKMTILGQNIQKKIIENFSREIMIKKIIELYN
jgi:glycosyltransferase involved in cell wall biosynthesis